MTAEVTTQAPRALRRAKLAVGTMFFVNGAAYATWVSRIPALRDTLGLRDRTLGIILLFGAAGAISAFSIAAKAIHTFGSRTVTRASSLVFCASIPIIAVADSAVSLGASIFFAGAASGFLDVAMNENAVIVEKQHGTPILSAIHGVFSLGGLVGALVGAAAASAGLSTRSHFLLATALFATLALVMGPLLLETRALTLTTTVDDPRSEGEGQEAHAESAAPREPSRGSDARTLLALGAVAACSSIGEGAMADWTAVYLTDTLGAPAGVAALGFAAYSLAMLTGRFSGDRVSARLGDIMTVRVGGALVTIGLVFGLLLQVQALFFLGVVVCGLGLSVLVPIIFRASGRLPNTQPGKALAIIATLAYSGFLLGPPTIGFLADTFTLRRALLVIPVLGLGIIALAGTLRKARETPPAAR